MGLSQRGQSKKSENIANNLVQHGTSRMPCDRSVPSISNRRHRRLVPKSLWQRYPSPPAFNKISAEVWTRPSAAQVYSS